MPGLPAAFFALMCFASPAVAELDLDGPDGPAIYAAGGFVLQGGNVLNRCGQQGPAPTIRAVDLNGDGAPELIFTDAGPCYPGGHWTAIVANVARTWVPVLTVPANVTLLQTKSHGWVNVAVDSGTVAVTMHYNGTRYVTEAAKTHSASRPAPAPEVVAPSPPTVVAPPAATLTAPPDAELPRPRSGETAITLFVEPDPVQKAAVLAALVTENAQELAAEGHEVHFVVAEADLNGDGRPDLIARMTDSDWCSSSGCSAVAVLATAKGYSHKPVLLANIDAVVFVGKGSHHGLHDLRFDDSDHVFRWSGEDYR